MDMPDVLILDGYVDEPSLLGVPPYISPYPRLLAGVAEELGLSWEYITADDWRREKLPEAEILLVHGGVTVPGKYLGGTPLSPREAGEIGEKFNGETFLGGPLAKYCDVKGYDHYSKKDLSAYVYDYFRGEAADRWSSLEERERWLKNGAKVVKKHPLHPDPLLAEVSLYRGCVRYFTGGCSFCSEPAYGKPEFRKQEDVAEEMGRLYDLGVRHFRIGGQSCTVSYMAEGVGEKERPVPQPEEIEKLFDMMWERCPEIKVLHLDNANPAVISEYPERGREIMEILVENTTPGNVLALGMESADPAVIESNNLNARPADVERAVGIINEAGRERGGNGMPKLLPGINFLAGLKGETSETYRKNMEFLRRLRDKGLWLRRINIRQVLTHRGKFGKADRSDFLEFKRRVNEEVNRPLLKEMFPRGTVLRDVYMEKRDGKTTFGRQIGTYPILVGVEYPLELGKYYGIAVTDYGYRSITGVEYPMEGGDLTFEKLKALPGVGEKRASKIFVAQPNNMEELRKILEDDELAEKISKYIKF